MKHTYTLITLFALSFAMVAQSQVPQGFSYQAVLRDANGDVMVNENVYMRFTIMRSFYEIAYQGEYSTSTNEFGLVNITVGLNEDELNPNYGNYASIDWVTYTNWYMQVELWHNSAWVDFGSQQIQTVPYAVHSTTSNTATDMSLEQLTDVGYEEPPADGDQLVYSDYFAEWVPSSVVPNFSGNAWSVDGSNAFRLDGNIGIGTSTPVYGLHLHNKQGLHLTTTATGSSFLDGFYLGQEDPSTVTLVNFENGPMAFHTNFAERMRISADGNVGIGTATPNTGLHMHNKNGMRLTKTFTGTSLLDGFYLGQDIFNNGHVYFTNYENADIIFNVNLAERMRITPGSVNVTGAFNVDDVTTNDLDANTINTSSITSIDALVANILVEDLTLITEAGAGNRPLFVNTAGVVFADDTYAELQTQSYAGSAFQIQQPEAVSDNAIQIMYHNLLGLSSEGNSGTASCPVHLPDGAIVNAVKGHFNNDIGFQTMVVELYNVEFNNQFIEAYPTKMAEVIGFIIEGTIDLTYTSNIEDAVIDNNNKVYYLRLKLSQSQFEPDGQVNKLYGVMIYYTMPN